MSRETYSIQYGDTTIAYDLAYAPRTTLAISVAPDLRVSVTAPPDTDPKVIAVKVRQRAPWILRQWRELEQYLPATPPRQYRSGETHLYLGRQYRLKVEDGAPAGVKLARGRLHVTTRDRDDTERVRQLLDDWYDMRARRVFPERIRAMLPRFASAGVTEPALIIRLLEARWGSCSGTGIITLNVRLMQVPKLYIDYVVVHELCHLVEHNHNKRFYTLLDQMMPDWRERRQALNELALG
jgi:predicted metal-dependent hydrolase